MDELTENLLSGIAQCMQMFRAAEEKTQKQVAAERETSQARVSGIEAGKDDLRLSTLVRWADYYGYEVQIAFFPKGSHIVGPDDLDEK